MNGKVFDEALTLREIVKAEVWRGFRGFYSESPDESLCVNDLITTVGRTHIANRMCAGDTVASKMNFMAVGTVSTAAALANTTLTGEVKRKALAVYSATANLVTAVCTFGGFAETITSLQMTEAGIFNRSESGFGDMMQRVTFAAVTLADSDLVKITLQTNVGSS